MGNQRKRREKGKIEQPYSEEVIRKRYNTMPDGEEIYFIPNPALGLWIDKSRFEA